MGDERDRIADERDRVADERERVADAREARADARDHQTRRILLDADERDQQAERRDREAEARGPVDAEEQAAIDRIHAGRDRDAWAADRANLLDRGPEAD